MPIGIPMTWFTSGRRMPTAWANRLRNGWERDLRVLPGFSERIRRPCADAGRHDHDLSAPRMTALGTGEQRRTPWANAPAVARRAPAPPAPQRRRPVRRRPRVVDGLAAAAGLGLGVTVALAVTSETAGSLSAPGGIAIALGRLTGLLAAYAMVVVVLLVA